MHFFDTTPFIWKSLAFLVSFRKSMSLQNLNVFEANHLSGTSYVLFERYFSPEVSLWKILMFSHFYYYTTPKQTGSNLLSAKSWVPTTGGCVRNAALRRPAALLDFFLVEVSGDEILALDQSGWNHLRFVFRSWWVDGYQSCLPQTKKKMLTIPSMEAIRIWFSYEETAMVEPLQGRQSH